MERVVAMTTVKTAFVVVLDVAPNQDPALVAAGIRDALRKDFPGVMACKSGNPVDSTIMGMNDGNRIMCGLCSWTAECRTMEHMEFEFLRHLDVVHGETVNQRQMLGGEAVDL